MPAKTQHRTRPKLRDGQVFIMARNFDLCGLARYSQPKALVALKKSGHKVAHFFMFVDIGFCLDVGFPRRGRRFIRNLPNTVSELLIEGGGR